MNTNVKLAAIGLAAALVGGSAGATLTSWRTEPSVAQNQPASAPVTTSPDATGPTTTPSANEPLVASASVAPMTQSVARPETASASRAASEAEPAPTRPRRATHGSSSRQVNYDYGQPRASSAPSAYTYRNEPSFWDKHRDKLTVGMGAAGGALFGGLFGGKKGAGIGALAGAGGSALYTYKIRKRSPQY